MEIAFDFRGALMLGAPGLILTPDMELALWNAWRAAAFAPLIQPQILAVVLPFMPEGNPPQYRPGAPVEPPAIMPGASPVFGPALPPQPNILLPIDGNPALGTVATFARGMQRWADSNPDPRDGWSVEWLEDDGPMGPR